MGASKSTISVFLPIFFSALVVCGVALCACAYCHRPNYFTYIRGWGGGTGDDDEDEDPEKGRRRKKAKRRRRRPEPQVIAVETESAGRPMPGGYAAGGQQGDFSVVSVDPSDAEEIEVVEVHPDLDWQRQK